MRRFILSVALLATLLVASRSDAAVPARPEQPHTDIFTAAGIANMQTLNPVTVKAKVQFGARYRLITMPGCSGPIAADLAVVESEARKLLNFNLVRDDFAYDFTVRLNCGTSHIAICTSINIFCLGRGFPYNADVDISDVMYVQGATWPFLTRISILFHEIVGHAVATWNEQYCMGNVSYAVGHICRGLGQFASAPGWRDFMNTGPNSRHLPEAIEIERWERTMYAVVTTQVPCDPCYNGSQWRFVSGWGWEPATDRWFDPRGRVFFNAREPWGGRCSPVSGLCSQPGVPFYLIDVDQWFVTP